jgi:iron complex outermembrane recepter protein
MMIKQRLNGSFFKAFGHAIPTAIVLGGALGVATSAHSEEVAPAQPSAGTSGQGTGSVSLEEIVVTATRRSESIQDVPMSISAVSQADLEKAGATQVEDVVHMVPGLAYTQNSVGQAVIAIRGIQTSALTGNVQQPVEIYYDDVPVLDLTIPWTVPALQLFDVDRVEVLRGPQGTLFGAGSLSGALRVITNKPDLSEFHGAVEDSVTTMDGGGVGGAANVMVNVPLIRDQLAVRAVYYYDYTAGWIDNPTLDERRTNHAKVSGGRIEAEWKPADSFELVATAAQEVTSPHDSNYVPYGSKSDIADNRIPNYNTDDLKIFNLAGTYSMPWATLTSSTSYLDRTATSSLDFSGEAGELTGLTTIAPLIDGFATDDLLQEFRLASSQEHPFKWLVGTFLENYRFNDCETITQAGVSGLTAASGGNPGNYLESTCLNIKIKDAAGFAEVSYDLRDGLTLTAGARYSHYSITTHDIGGLNGTDLFDGPLATTNRLATDHSITPKVSLSYKLNEDAMVYVLADEGYRTGNSNLAPPKDPFTGLPLPQSYQPDELWNYEAGTKLAFFDRRLRIDADVFYIDWKKIQLQIRAPVSGIPYTANAGTATSKGVELQMVGKPTNSTEVGGSLAYTDAKLISISPGVPATVGDQLPGSAPFTTYLYGQYDFPVFGSADLSLRADYSFTGKEFAYLDNKDNPDALTYGNYSSIGTQATLHVGRYEVGLFGSNLANSRKRVAARINFPEVDEVLQTPRMIGVRFRATL